MRLMWLIIRNQRATRMAHRAISKFWPWRFVLASLATLLLGFSIAFEHSMPTAGYTHWPGSIVSVIMIFICITCFAFSPRHPPLPRFIALALPVLPLFSMLISGCSTPPKLSADDRQQDIDFLAKWVRDCSPLATLSEKHKGFPNGEALRGKYLQLAEKAVSNEDFYLIMAAYFNVVGAGSCHAYLCPEALLKWGAIGQCLGIYDWGISTRQLWAGAYWPRLAAGISTRAHPPFRIAAKTGHYYLEEDYPFHGRTVPQGSEIIKVNGMSCSSYLSLIKTNTSLCYEAFPQDWADNYLLIVDEGPAFHGWPVEFLLPDGSMLTCFAPKKPGFPLPKNPETSVDAKENCTCVELTETVAYIRIKGMWHGPLSYFFKSYIKKERQKIREFLEQGQGKYQKLIIDIRDNGGGVPEYVYQNLVCPFLKEPVSFRQIAGVREKYLENLKPAAFHDFKKQYDLHITETKRVKAPAGLPDHNWVWYEITRQLRPTEQYRFGGKLYVLINGGSGSAADDYADLVRRLQLGTLVGQNTGGGGGAYLAPGIIRLPRSGMIFRMETEIMITPEGNVDELFGTAPDVKLPSAARPASITRDDLLKDEWITYIVRNY